MALINIVKLSFTIFQHCSPCLINYDGVIRLETSVMDEEFVLTQSKISQYIELKYRHYKTHEKKSEENLNKKYFSHIPCSLLSKLIQMYRMDLEMFDYSVDDFKNFCSK